MEGWLTGSWSHHKQKLHSKHVIEGNIKDRIEVTGRRGRRRKQLPNESKEKRGYWKLKEEALDCTVWGISFGRGFGSGIRQTAE
jgi:hypothetical protein